MAKGEKQGVGGRGCTMSITNTGKSMALPEKHSGSGRSEHV